jgi:hypothetical protein
MEGSKHEMDKFLFDYQMLPLRFFPLPFVTLVMIQLLETRWKTERQRRKRRDEDDL